MPISTAKTAMTVMEPRWRAGGRGDRRDSRIIGGAALLPFDLDLLAEPFRDGLAEALQIALPGRGGDRPENRQGAAGAAAVGLGRQQRARDIADRGVAGGARRRGG